MPSNADHLQTRLAYLYQKLAELEEGAPGELPNVAGEGEIDHAEYHKRLRKDIDDLESKYERLRSREVFEIASELRSG